MVWLGSVKLLLNVAIARGSASGVPRMALTVARNGLPASFMQAGISEELAIAIAMTQ